LRTDWVISGSLHVAVLLVGLVTVASSRPTEEPPDYVPVGVVSNADISRLALGQENAAKPRGAKPLADAIGDTKSVKQLAPKIAKRTITTQTPPLPQPAPQPESKPEPKPKQAEKHEPKPERHAERKPEPKQGEKPAKQTPSFKPDQIAALLKKDDHEKPRDKPRRETPKYDPNQIAQLLDHRDPQREAATAASLNNTPSLGAPNAAPEAQLSQSEIDALRERIRECWSPPPGVDSNSNISVSLRVEFRPDGSLAQMPIVVSGSASPLGPALAESGKRALLACQPFTMLKPEHYAQWKDITVDFDPRDLSSN
jgi:outer membrane biosynthesis protein TonB